MMESKQNEPDLEQALLPWRNLILYKIKFIMFSLPYNIF